MRSSGTATGTIESKTWDFEPLAELEGGRRLIRMSATDLFHGDIEGETRAEFVATLGGDNSSEFAGIYLFSGDLEGRRGTFMLRTVGASDASGFTQGEWQVVRGSGTGELEGLNGSGEFSYRSGGPSSLTLAYGLGD
jgi:hypothetical protein